MSQSIAQQTSIQFATTVDLLSQQLNSRLRNAVTVGNYVGKQGEVVQQLGPSVAQRRTTRYTPIAPVEHVIDRRWVFPEDYHWAEWADKTDMLRMVADPKGPYVNSGLAAMNRAIDDVIITSIFATAKTGDNGSTSTTFPASQQVSASEGASAATGLNVEKLKAGIQLLLANEAWDPSSGERISCIISAKQNRNLMDEVQVINADYNGEKAVVNDGFVMQWGKVDFIHSERLPQNGSSQYRVPFFIKRGLHLGIWNDINATVTVREDLAGHPWQAYMAMTLGATRVEEKAVVEIPCV